MPGSVMVLDQPRGLISEGNSTTTPLAGSATFTGTAEQNFFPNVICSCFSDVAGTLYFDFSVNGTDWRTFPVNGFTVDAGRHEFHNALKGPRFFRVRFVNGAAAQSLFQLSIYYGTFGSPNSPLNQNRSPDSDALLVRNYPSSVDVALGRLGGIQERAKYGFNPDMDTGTTPEMAWQYGGMRTENTGSSFTIFVTSSSASDTDVDVTIEYLDADGMRSESTVNLNGQTPVDTGITATDSFRAFIASTSNNDVVGNVYATNANNFTSGVPDNDNEVLWEISAGQGQTQVCADKVPTDKIYILKWLDVRIARSSGAAGSAQIEVQVKENGSPAWLTKIPLQITTASPASRPLGSLTLAAGDQFRVNVTSVSDNNTSVSATLLIDEVPVQ